MNGRKAQIHLTLECNIHCYFCPIKKSEFGKDVVEFRGQKYDASSPLETIIDAIVEDENLFGVAISGGEPLMHPDRVYRTIEHLRRVRGDGFHIHLYSNGIVVNDDIIAKLNALKIDEMRVNSLHPRVFQKFRRANFDVICEVPCIPDDGYFKRLCAVLDRLPECGIKRLNLNELEATEETRRVYLKKGFVIEGNRAVDSAHYATMIREYIDQRNLDIGVFFCNFETAEKIRISRNRLAGGTL
jgi:pyruvate formate-lyase activating enzyme-like uncharacterized protein